MNEVQKFALKFIIVLLLASFLTFGGITLSFYVAATSFLPENLIRQYLLPFVFVASCLLLVFAISVSYVFYQLLVSYHEQQRQSAYFFELLLEIVAHKFGNFIAGMKVNLSVLKAPCEAESDYSVVTERLRRSVRFMETEFLQILSAIKDFKNKKSSASVCSMSLDEIIQDQQKRTETLRQDHTPPQVLIKGRNTKFSRFDEALMVHLLLENAFKYSKSIVKIRCGRFKKDRYLFISNDVADNRTPGLGIGLTITDFIARKNGFKLLWKESPSSFMVLFARPV